MQRYLQREEDLSFTLDALVCQAESFQCLCFLAQLRADRKNRLLETKLEVLKKML